MKLINEQKQFPKQQQLQSVLIPQQESTQMQHNNQRFLKSSPTAATLHQYQSVSSLESVPPLVSIHDDTEPIQTTNKFDVKQQNWKANDRFNKTNKFVAKQQKLSNSPHRQSKQTTFQPHLNKPKTPKSSLKKIISSQSNPYHQVYTSKLRHKQNSSPTYLITDEAEKQQSYAESVYLDLEEYSSIHKYQSISPYYEEFDEDKEYVRFLGNQHRDQYGSIGNIHINLDGEESLAKSRVPRLTTAQKDPQSQSKISSTQMPEIHKESPTKPKRNDPNPKRSPIQNVNKQFEFGRVFKRIQEEKDFEDGNSHKYSGEFNQFEGQGMNKMQSRIKIGSQMAELGLQIFNQCLEERFKPPVINIKAQQSGQQQSTRLFAEIMPEWYVKNNTGNSLRLILTKPPKLTQYLKYLTQLQIRLKKHKHNHQITQIQNRNDTNPQSSPSPSPRRQVTVHYENEKQYLQSGMNQKLKFSQPLSKKLAKQSVTSIKSAQFAPMSYHLPSTISETGRSMKSKSVVSDHVSTLNVFTGSANRNKNKQYPEVISEIHSQVDIDQNILPKDIHKTNRICKDQIDVLKLLQVLLVKLSNKKCNIYLKQTTTTQQTHDELYSTPSQKIANLMQILTFNKSQNSPIKATEISKIQFHEYDHSKNVEDGKMSYTDRIRELTEELESKEKYLYEFKAGYDYVVNNYITTIANLKNGKDVGEKDMEYMVESKGMSARQSQPMTFKMSKNQSFEDEDQWIGNPGEPQVNLQSQEEISKLRRSLPEKN